MTPNDRFQRPSDRAVSEVLGYILIFSLVVSSIGLITFAGYDSLESVREGQQTQTAERAYEIFATHIEDVYVRGAPSRATEMTLGDASLEMAPRVTTIKIDLGTTGTNEIVHDVRPVVYETDDGQKLVYAMGAVFRTSPSGGGVVLRDAPFAVRRSSDHVMVPIIVTYSQVGGVQSISGGKGIIRAQGTDKRVERYNTYSSVSVTIESPNADLWKETLVDAGFSESECSVSTSPSEVTCTYDQSGDETVIVTRHNIGIEIEN